MAITVKTLKEVSSAGEKGYRVLSIEALERDKLPTMYIEGYPRVWKVDKCGDRPHLRIETGVLNPEQRVFIYKGRFYSAKKMTEYNTIIAEAGQRLHDINKHLAREQTKWQGTVTFVDGEEKPSSAKEEIPSIKTLRKEGRLYYRNKKGQIVPLKERRKEK